MGLNDAGVVACVLNRSGHLGPASGKRTRGELVLEALDHADAVDAVAALADLAPRSYRPFNMIVADNRDSYWLRHSGVHPSSRIEVAEIPQGISMLTSQELNDRTVPRIACYLDRFREAARPNVTDGDWRAWTGLLAERSAPGATDPRRAMTVVSDDGYGTMCGSLLALAAPEIGKPVWLFAAGRPGEAPFKPVSGL